MQSASPTTTEQSKAALSCPVELSLEMYLMLAKNLIAALRLQLPYWITEHSIVRRKLGFCMTSYWEGNAEFSADSLGPSCWSLFSREAALFTLCVGAVSLAAVPHMGLLRCEQKLKQLCLGKIV